MMTGHKNCQHGRGASWTLEPARRWFDRCGTCKAFRPWGDYYEVYGEVDRWWWECERCLIATISTAVEEEQA